MLAAVIALVEMNRQQIMVRTRVVAFNEKDEVLVQHGLTPENDFYRLPGGGVRFREKLEDCVVREIKEETGLDVKVLRLLWVRDFLDESLNHSIEPFFLVTVTVGKLKPSLNSEQEFMFVTVEELEKVLFYPKAFIPKLKLLRDNRDWTEENSYVRSAN